MIIFDLETNGLLETVDKVWVASWLTEDGPQTETYRTGFYEFFKSLGKGQRIVGHNIVNYDLPVLKKLFDWSPSEDQELFDTTIWSRMLWPDIPTPKGCRHAHSLQAWAIRFGGEQKVEQEEWNVYDPNMVTRCESDVRITEMLYKKILKEIS